LKERFTDVFHRPYSVRRDSSGAPHDTATACPAHRPSPIYHQRFVQADGQSHLFEHHCRAVISILKGKDIRYFQMTKRLLVEIFKTFPRQWGRFPTFFILANIIHTALTFQHCVCEVNTIFFNKAETTQGIFPYVVTYN
jgi:hypothetical protein